MVLSGNTFAQNIMKVIPLNGTESSYEIGNIKKQTFLDGKMRIDFNDGTAPVEFDLAKKHKVVFLNDATYVKNMIAGQMEVILYPNPVTQVLFIDYKASKMNELRVSISTVNGRQVYCKNHPVSTGSNCLSVPVHDLNNGIYFCRVSNGEQAFVQKLIKK